MKALIILLAALLYAVAVLGLSRPAHAAPQCAPHEEVLAGLARNYGETVVALGITANGQLIEMFASPKGTFTIIVTSPIGLSCLAVSGGEFQAVTTALPPQGIPG